MGLLTRVFRLCKADLHGVMDQIEDRELLLKEHLREMADALEAAADQAVRLEDRQERLQRRLTAVDSRIAGLEKDLDLAVAHQRDDIARSLIAKAHPLRQQARQLTEERADAERRAAACRQRLMEQRGQYEQLRAQVAIAFRGSRPAGPETGDFGGEPADWPEPSAEEIEIELLQRKQAVQDGRTP